MPVTRITHTLRASSDVLISAPSMRVCFDECVVSAPRSLPAKSMKLSFPMVFGCGGAWTFRRPAAVGPSPRSELDAPRDLSRSTSCITWWDRDDSRLAPVEPVERCVCARAMRSRSWMVGCKGGGGGGVRGAKACRGEGFPPSTGQQGRGATGSVACRRATGSVTHLVHVSHGVLGQTRQLHLVRKAFNR